VTKKSILQLGIACLAVVGYAESRSDAALVLNLNNGAVVVNDNGAGDLDPAIGRLVASQTVGGTIVSVTAATSNSPGTATAGLLQLQQLEINNSAAGGAASLRVQISDTGYTAPGGAATPMTLDSDFGGTFTNAGAGNTVTFQSFADPANAQPPAGTSTAVLTATKSGGQATEQFSGSNQANWTRGAGAYSLGAVANITINGGSQVNVSGTTTATAVPEPASFACVGAAGLLALRRRKVR